jgi:hypothetical protein
MPDGHSDNRLKNAAVSASFQSTKVGCHHTLPRKDQSTWSHPVLVDLNRPSKGTSWSVRYQEKPFNYWIKNEPSIIAWTTKPLTAILSSLVQISKEDIPRGFTCSHAQAHKPSQRKTQHIMFRSMRLMEFWVAIFMLYHWQVGTDEGGLTCQLHISISWQSCI